MISLWNGLLVLISVPLLATSALLLYLPFSPGMREYLGWKIWGVFLPSCIGACLLFFFVYQIRSQWLLRKGIVGSWALFREHAEEHNAYPPVAEKDYARFLNWMKPMENLGCAAREGDISAMQIIYLRIHSEHPNEKSTCVYSLLRYLDKSKGTSSH